MKLVTRWFFVGVIFCLVSTSVIKAIYYDNIFAYSKELKQSEKSFTTSKEPVCENLSPNILEYPPYLQRFRGRMPINGVQANKDNSQIFFGRIVYGVACYFPENDSMRTLSFENPISETIDENTILDIALDENQSKLYVGAWTGLIIVDLTDWSYEQKNFSDGYSINEIRCLYFDEQDQMLFIGTDIGLRIYFTNNQTFLDTAKLPDLLKNPTTGIDVADLIYDSFTKGLYMAHYDALSVYNISSGILKSLYLPTHSLRSLALDVKNDRIFLGSNGLIVLNLTNNQEIAHYGNHPNPMYAYDTLNLFFEPHFGGMVFGSITWDGGTFVVNTTADKVIFLNKTNGLLEDFVSSFEPFMDNSTGTPKDYMLIACKGGFCYYDYTTNNITKSLLLDHDIPSNQASYLSLNSELNHLYIGCNNDYLSVLDLNTNINIANYDYTNELPTAYIGYTQFYSKNNTLFIDTSEGLVLFNLTSNKTIRLFTTLDGLLDNGIQAILLDEESANLFIATINGFNVLNLDTLEITQYLQGLNCYSLTLDNDGQNLYIGADCYLKILSLTTMIFTSITLPGTSLNCYDIQLYEAKQIAFLPTQNGLYILDLSSMIFLEHFTRDNSPLSNNLLYKGIHFDEQTGNLFISNIDITVFNYDHNFWLNLNDAKLDDEGLYKINTDSIVYTNNKLFLGTFSYGLFIIDHRDEDADGIFDCYEVWLFGTNPALNDTDYDGYTDGEELWAGTDPLDPNSYPINVIVDWSIAILGIISGFDFMIVIGIIFYKYCRIYYNKKNE